MTTSVPEWQYDETLTSGVDYTHIEQVAAYDRMHQKFRDYAKGTAEIIQKLNLGPDQVVIDLGCGTGAFALNAAGSCRRVIAVDISKAMLDYCRAQADSRGLDNILFHQGGLLTYEHQEKPADAMVCVAVLHHLPDFWKQKALTRLRSMLKPGGRFFLFDIVLPSVEANLDEKITDWIQAIERAAGERLAREAAIHIKDEFSTFDWVMEGMLRRSGFRLDSAEYREGFQTTYICTNP